MEASEQSRDEPRTRDNIARAWRNIEVVRPADALRRDPRDLVVPEETELVLSPEDPDLTRHFARVVPESFADLQTLGLVPRAAAEERVRAAIASDDEATRVRTLTEPVSGCGGSCGCAAGAGTSAQSTRNAVRGAYTQLRSFHNPALAAVLSEHHMTQLAWDDAIVAVAHKWVTRVGRESYLQRPLLVSIFEDITVKQGATLVLEKNLTSLFAHEVWIHRRGRVVQQGSYTKIWAGSVMSFRGMDQIVNSPARPAWLLGL